MSRKPLTATPPARQTDDARMPHGIFSQDGAQSRLGDLAQGRFRLPTVRKPVPFRTLVARYREHAEAHHRGYRASRYTLNQLEAEFSTMALADLSAFASRGGSSPAARW